MNKWNKIKKTDLRSLGEAPTETSENIKAPELAPKDKRFTGRNKRIAFTCRPEFAEELRKLAFEKNCYQIEILEKALEIYKREESDKKLEKYVKVIERKKFSHPNETFTCDKCGARFQNETAYSYSSSLGKLTKTYCGDCV